LGNLHFHKTNQNKSLLELDNPLLSYILNPTSTTLTKSTEKKMEN
jgi:hypothetical protein